MGSAPHPDRRKADERPGTLARLILKGGDSSDSSPVREVAMLKFVVALTVLAGGGTALMVLPEPAPVEAPPAVTAEEPKIQADAPPVDRCGAWPYLHRSCLVDGRTHKAAGASRKIRLIQSNPLAIPDDEPTTVAAAVPPAPAAGSQVVQAPAPAAQPAAQLPVAADPAKGHADEPDVIITERRFVSDGPNGQGHWVDKMTRMTFPPEPRSKQATGPAATPQSASPVARPNDVAAAPSRVPAERTPTAAAPSTAATPPNARRPAPTTYGRNGVIVDADAMPTATGRTPNEWAYAPAERDYGRGGRDYARGERGYARGEQGYARGERAYARGEQDYVRGERDYAPRPYGARRITAYGRDGVITDRR
jgi:hypothetical protein